jgi:hypothetical protein
VVRKEFGYAHIPQRHAVRFNTYCREYLNPFLNFHRPCLFATDQPDPKKPGRIKRVYRPQDAMTPLDKLASLPEANQGLRAGMTLAHLRALAMALTDMQAAEELNDARQALTNLGNVTHWITDHQGRVRLGAASDDRTLRARCVYDARNDKPSKLGNLTSWLPEAQMAPMKPMRYTARDGLEFPG